MTQLTEFLGIIWFLLPGIAANVAPIFAAHWWPAWRRPLWQSGFGAHKTWRGLGAGMVAAALMGVVQYMVQMSVLWPWEPVMYFSGLWAAVGVSALLGAAALGGDSLKSFIKRRLHKPSGANWAPWDQVDFVIGMILVAIFFTPLSVLHIFSLLVVLGFGSLVTSGVGVALGIKKSL